MFKKIISLISVICIFISGSFMTYGEETDAIPPSVEDYTNESTLSQIFVTSNGITFNLSDIEVYIEDFDGITIETSQEMIDYIYEVGMRNIKTRDEKISIFGKSLTPDELSLIVTHPFMAAITYYCSEKAQQVAQDAYSGCSGDGELGNAFQHAYWVLLMYYRTPPTCYNDFAIDFAVAHENYNGNPTIHKTMDLYNDYAAYSFCIENSGSGYTDETLAVYTEDLMNDGELIYIVFDYEYISKMVYNSISGTTQTYYATADLYAYTNSEIPYNIPDIEYEVFPAGAGGTIIKP